jgi:CDP-glucose 4,6-dehydratase
VSGARAAERSTAPAPAGAVDPAFWHGRRVLVTGDTGFKGAWLCLWLQRMGALVSGYSDAVPTSPSLYELARLGERSESLRGDVRDLEALAGALGELGPEVVVHMAAQPLVRRSHQDPAGTFGVNALGTVNLLEAVRRANGVRAVVVVTTDKVYAEGPGTHAEDDALGGSDPFSASKACAELAADTYRSAFFSAPAAPAVATARAGNVIGGGDWGEDRLVPDLVRAALAGERVRIRNPDAIRPWQHVLNPLSGYLALARRLLEEPSAAGEWNFGPAPADERPVRWVIERLARHWGEEIRWEPDAGDRPRESPVLRIDSARARGLLGWEPRWDLDAGLAAVAAWHRAVAHGADPREVCMAQIDAFYAGDAPPAGA